MTTSCVRCPEPATATIGVEHYCPQHHAEVLDPIRARVIHPIDLDGHGHQTGPRRPDWGPGWADLTCTTCAATWTGPIGEPCWWCEQRNRYMVAQHIETVLTPPDIDADHTDRLHVLAAWLQRMMVARDAGLITREEAERAWQRETRRDRGRAA